MLGSGVVPVRFSTHMSLSLDLPPERLVGVFVRDATPVFEDPVVEILP